MSDVRVWYVLRRHTGDNKVDVPAYYNGLSIFWNVGSARRRIKSLKRTSKSPNWEYRILPWHTEMGEMDSKEMWRSALAP